jgi:hypothetical protein
LSITLSVDLSVDLSLDLCVDLSIDSNIDVDINKTHELTLGIFDQVQAKLVQNLLLLGGFWNQLPPSGLRPRFQVRYYECPDLLLKFIIV